MPARPPFVVRVCLVLLRVVSVLVPRESRVDWRAEWDAEIRHRSQLLEREHHLGWRPQMDLLRRASGALPDAAWIRRQFTTDADLVHDIRHGLRVFWKSPAFALSAVLILSLGIGGTVSLASLLDTLLFRPLPYAESERVVTIWQKHAARQEREDVAPANFLDWRERSRSFASIGALIPYSYDYTGAGDPEVFFGAQVTEGFWDALGIRPMLGRAFLADEHVRGGPRAVIISNGLWQRKFGGDPQIVGKRIVLDSVGFTIVGVLPREFAPQLLPRPGELGVWTPKVIQDSDRRTRGSAWWNVVARLKPGVTVEQAQRELDDISIALAHAYPRSNQDLGVAVVPMRQHLMGGLRLPLFMMLGAIVAVLAIGCANVASLLLARGLQREREFAIRSALGAGRGRLIRQLITECLLLSGVAALTGIALAHALLRTIVALAPGGVLRLQEASIDARMLVFAAAVTTATALAVGLLPALQFSRGIRHGLAERNTTGPRAAVRAALVTAEIALAIVLLAGAGLLVRSFSRVLAVDPGFRPAHVVALQVFAGDRNDTAAKVREFFRRTLANVRSVPGVESAGAVSAMPFMMANIDIKSPLEVAGRAAGPDAQVGVHVTIASPGYFQTMSIPLREGRLIDDRDDERGARVVVISEALRSREWPSESPLGRKIRFQWSGTWRDAEVVGVVAQIRHDGLDRAPRPEIFVPLSQLPFSSMTYVVKSSADPATVIGAVKREIWSVDPLQTFYDVSTVQRLVDVSVAYRRFSMTLMSAFALLALVLCAIGLYGLISFTTAQRTREIGVRMALGADVQSIRRMVLREGAALVGLGLTVGVAAALAATRYLDALLFGITAADPATFAGVCVMLGVVALVACYIPARRATRVDPLIALRIE